MPMSDHTILCVCLNISFILIFRIFSDDHTILAFKELASHFLLMLSLLRGTFPVDPCRIPEWPSGDRDFEVRVCPSPCLRWCWSNQEERRHLMCVFSGYRSWLVGMRKEKVIKMNGMWTNISEQRAQCFLNACIKLSSSTSGNEWPFLRFALPRDCCSYIISKCKIGYCLTDSAWLQTAAEIVSRVQVVFSETPVSISSFFL